MFRIILQIRRPQKISNADVRNIGQQEDIMVDLTLTKWSWIGRVLRRETWQCLQRSSILDTREEKTKGEAEN